MDISKDELRRTVNKQRRDIHAFQKILSQLTSMSGVSIDKTLSPNTITFVADSENAIEKLASNLVKLGYEPTIREIDGGLSRFTLTIDIDW